MKKTYTIEYTETKDGICKLVRTNNGFTALELLGTLTLAQTEILEQMKGVIKPNIIERNVINRKKK